MVGVGRVEGRVHDDHEPRRRLTLDAAEVATLARACPEGTVPFPTTDGAVECEPALNATLDAATTPQIRSEQEGGRVVAPNACGPASQGSLRVGALAATRAMTTPSPRRSSNRLAPYVEDHASQNNQKSHLAFLRKLVPVSYTHLTLPTSDLV